MSVEMFSHEEEAWRSFLTNLLSTLRVLPEPGRTNVDLHDGLVKASVFIVIGRL